MSTMPRSFWTNQWSMPDRRAISSTVAPRRRAAITIHKRSSVGVAIASRRSIGLPPSPACQAGSSQRSDRPPNSRERTALPRAASKVRSMAITSPVAFICVPVVRSPRGNLSKGQRGILTTT